ncbi:unnamed protein product [Brugia timori]|uniref:PDEase domain-containing protein n=1 Tax=Brugia timori TaxID=42155 RepID=A0A0R3QVQ7_9BILA|nr:unnamed protein product [Brugia timori]
MLAVILNSRWDKMNVSRLSNAENTEVTAAKCFANLGILRILETNKHLASYMDVNEKLLSPRDYDSHNSDEFVAITFDSLSN